jgi:hypothetical protein
VDFSKLPKLSETKPELPAQEPPRPEPTNYGSDGRRQMAVGAEIWISFALGALLIYLCSRPIEYVLTRSHPETFSGQVTDANGAPVSYPSSIFFLPDLGVCVFGIVLILDGLQMLLARSLAFSLFAFLITLAATLLNVVAIISAFHNNMGLQILCFLAVILGGYTAVYQWNAVKALRQSRQIPTVQ